MNTTVIKKTILLFVLISAMISNKAISQPVTGFYDELVEIFPDSKIESPITSYSVDAARGTKASVHILIVKLSRTKSIQFEAKDTNGKSANDIKWFRMIDVPVTENTGLDRATEKFSRKINPYVIRRAPFRIYEALAPVKSPLAVDSSTIALRAEFMIGQEEKTGKKSYKFLIKIDEKTVEMDFTINIHESIVPPVNKSTIYYVNWMGLDRICKAHNVERFSEPFWDMLKKYAKLIAEGRQNTFWFIWNEFFSFNDDGSVKSFDSTNLKRYIKTFLNEGLHTIEGAPFLRRRNWESDAMLVSLPGGKEISAVSEQGKNIISEMARSVIMFMKENNWEKIWLQGVFDEPTDEYVERYKEIITLVRGLKPDIKILEATMTTNAAGYIDCYCPQVQEYQAHQKLFDDLKQSSNQVWVYTCLAPGGPWLNRLVDQERLRPVYIGWACAKYDLQGFLHWGLNKQRGNPFTDLVVQHGDSTNYLPAGDSHIIYPLPDGPISSQRFEAHRIGMEDYELLSQLKSKDSARMQKVINIVFHTFDEYSKDIMEYRRAKKIMLEYLDEAERN